MRQPLLIAVCAALTSLVAAQDAPRPSSNPADSQTFLDAQLHRLPPLSPARARRVRSLVAQMTLKEKVGQMTQLEVGMITDGSEGKVRVNPEKLRKAVVDYGVGSILNVKDIAVPPAKWHEIIGAIARATAQTRLRVPVIYGLDSVHGANYVAGATIFPQQLGLAATWDYELARDAAAITAAETRSAGVPWNFSPVLDVGRQPLWPRLYETFGEDPYLASVMGAAVIRGYQGDDPSAPTRVAATMKHYIGYSVPVSGHDRTPAMIPERMLRETLLPPFAAGVKAGALSVMVNSGEVNGIPGHVNRHLLNDVLRGELGFDGVIVSDWEDIKKLVYLHHTAANEKDATRAAVLAGIDMSMVPSDYSFSDLLVKLVNEGAVPVARINDAVTRILTLKARVGLLDPPSPAPAAAAVTVGSPASRQAALRGARESIVLAKNSNNVLPFGSSTRVLMTGPTADSLVALNNGWTITWLGDRASLYPSDRPTVRRALEAKLGNRASYVAGATFDKVGDLQAVTTAASSADVILVCLGEMSYAETPGNIDDLSLPDAQLELAETALATGKPVVLLMIEGRPRIINTIADRVAGTLIALNPGMEGGTAIAEILVGEVNPSGRLPITYPRFANALTTYDYKAYDEKDLSASTTTFKPQFAFASGLSYTTFDYSNLTADKSTTFERGIDVSVTVKNTGTRAGTEVVHLFVTDRVASVTPAVKRLVRFVRVDLAPGASRDIKFHLSRKDLSFIGASNRPVAEAGTFTLAVGKLSRDVEVTR
jgi:beta-glucosidase